MENSEAETEDGILHENLDLENNIFNIFDPEGLKLLTRLLLGFSHLNEHRFTLHRIDVMNNVKSICSNFEFMTDNNKIRSFFMEIPVLMETKIN